MDKERAIKIARQMWDRALDKDLFHYAASLSFNTFLALIPFIFISLSIFTNMPSFKEYEARIKDFIFSNLLPANSEAITGHIDQFLNNSSNLGIFGLVAVFFTSIMFFANFEYVVARLTNTKPRGFWHGLSVYWTLMTLMPLALGLSFYLTAYIQAALASNEYTRGLNFIAIFPYLIIWAIFAITFAISINRNLSVKSVLFSSFISSLVWEITKLVFIQYAVMNKTYASIYGSFSILFFFFIWIYISWIIILYGVSLCGMLNHENRAV